MDTLSLRAGILAFIVASRYPSLYRCEPLSYHLSLRAAILPLIVASRYPFRYAHKVAAPSNPNPPLLRYEMGSSGWVQDSDYQEINLEYLEPRDIARDFCRADLTLGKCCS